MKDLTGIYPDYWDDVVNGKSDIIGLSKQGILLAIEVKYASRYWRYDFKKLIRLQDSTPYSIVPIFAYVEASRANKESSTQYEKMLNKAKKNDIMLLFGNPHLPDDWKVDNVPTF